jgi:hypothetical protein
MTDGQETVRQENVTAKNVFGYVDKVEIFETKATFRELSGNQFQEADFIAPSHNFISEAVKTIRKERLLVLAGGYDDIDKVILAQYVAWFFSNQFNDDKKPSIKEWQRSSDPQSIEGELSKQEEPTIYLFPQVSRQNFNFGLSRIHQTAKNHYVIITTDTPQEIWNPSGEEQDFWINLDSLSYEIYSSESLRTALNNELKSEKILQSLQGDENLNRIVKQLQSLKGDKNLNKIVELKTPDKIVRLVSLLIRELKKGESLETAIDNAIDTVKNYQENLRDWYDFTLNDREKLLALGLNLFEGLFVDQFFAALEKVVEQVWQKRDPFLRALDYCDLSKVRDFFKFGVIGIDSSDQNKIESRVSKQRLILFEIAWKCHGRQIVAALPTITHLVKNSVDNRDVNEELYGTRTRRKQLRRLLSEAVGDMGWISPTAVQKALRQLAEDKQISVQNVAAQAIARWRDSNYYGSYNPERFEKRHQELFGLLNQWQDIASQSSLQKQSQTDNVKNDQTQDYLRSTIALTVGYAAAYDLPDKLHQELYDLLKRLSDAQDHDDQKNPAHQSFCFHTLPRVVPWHLVQLRDLLRDMTRYPDFIGAISDSLALAYQFRAKDVLDTLDFWKNGEFNEQLLITVALTYGKIQCDKNIYPFTTSQAFGQLQNLLKEEQNLRVRLAIVIAMGLKLRQNFEEIAPQFQHVIPEITRYEHEREKIVEILTFIYLEQRDSQDNDRVETAMRGWVADDRNPIAQEMAIRALVTFTIVSLDNEEVKRVKEKAFLNVILPKNSIVSKQPPYEIRFDKIIPWIVTRNEKSCYKTAIRNLLHEAWKRYNNSKDAMNSVLSNWEKMRDDEKIVDISHLLRQGFWWLKRFDYLLIGVTVLIVAPLSLMVSVMMKEQPAPFIEPTPPYIPIPLPPIPKSKAMIDSGINVAKKADVLDIDSDNFDGGKLTIQFTEKKTADHLGIHITDTSGEIDVKGKYNERQEIVYEVFHHNKVIGYFQDDNTGDLEIALTANATKAETKALVRTLAYQNTSNTPQLGDRKVELQLTDGDGGISKSFSKTISVVTKNEAPVIKVLDDVKNQTIRETRKLFINGISVSDAESQELTVTLQVTKGNKLTVKQNVPKGLKSKNIKHPGSEVVLKGTIEQINTTLADSSAITYQSRLGFSGEDLLQITVEDSGKKITSNDGLVWPPGAINPNQMTETVNITVIPAIIITVPDVQTVDEDTNLTISGIRIDAPDSKKADVVLEVGNGTLTIKDDVANGLMNKSIRGNGTKKVTLKRSRIDQLNATFEELDAITYRSQPDFSGNDMLTVQVNDGKKSASQHIKIHVVPINDEPQILEEEQSITQALPSYPVAGKTASISPTPQSTLGKRVRDIADVQYKKLSSPSYPRWWELVCQMMDEVYNQEVAKTKTTKQQDKQQIWQKVFNGTVDIIYQDERKKRNGWNRNNIKKKLSKCFTVAPPTKPVVRPEPPKKIVNEVYGIVTTKRTALNIRAYMSTYAISIYKAPKGSKLRILNLNQNGTWYKVQLLHNGRIGYASSDYITIIQTNR